MVCALIVDKGFKIQDLLDFYQRASGQNEVVIDEPLFRDEKLTGYTNHALTSLMMANTAFPSRSTPEETKSFCEESLDFYFQQCSILVDVQSLARFGAMLANNGINPTTGHRILKPSTVQATVTLMTTCGMYNGAGKFTKDLGVPSKSGVAGGLLTVIPGLGAFASFSPTLNEEGNTVRGIGIIRKLSTKYNNFNLFHRDAGKSDCTRKPFQTLIQETIFACSCAANGDLEGIVRLFNQGIDLNRGDYDQRTPVHLASAGGYLKVVKFLVETASANHSPKDRWGATPLNDAKNEELIQYFESIGAQKGNPTNYNEIPNMSVTDDQYRLLYAAANNDVPLMKALHLKGWQVNSYDYDGRTALGLAASEGHVDAIKYLLAHGANPKIKDARGNNSLEDAIRENRTQAIEVLKPYF